MSMRLRPTTELPPLPSDAPALDPSVVRDLKALNKGIHLHFSHWALSSLGAFPILNEDTGEPVPWPRWSIWIQDARGIFHLLTVLENPDGSYYHPDHRVVSALRSDPLRLYGPEEAYRRKKHEEGLKKAKGRQEMREMEKDFTSANKKWISEVMENPFKPAEKTVRSAPIYSYAGQGNHSALSETIETSHEFSHPRRER